MTDLEVIERVEHHFRMGGWAAGALSRDRYTVLHMPQFCLLGAIRFFSHGDVNIRSPQSERIVSALGFTSSNEVIRFNDALTNPAKVILRLQAYLDKQNELSVLRSRARKYPARITVTKRNAPLTFPSEWGENRKEGARETVNA